MTTRDFIAQVSNYQQTKPKAVSSVFFDGTHLYSYGKHYPLLINYKGKWLVNRTGYSNTTARHISYASLHADYYIKISNGDIGNLFETAKDNVNELQTAYNNLKRKTTKKAQALLQELNQYKNTLSFLANN